jgi:hypothetical protein
MLSRKVQSLSSGQHYGKQHSDQADDPGYFELVSCGLDRENCRKMQSLRSAA